MKRPSRSRSRADYPAAQPCRQGSNLRHHRQGFAAAAPIEINDELATKLGLESVDKLKEIVRGQIGKPVRLDHRPEGQAPASRSARELYQFDTPERLVDAEFETSGARSNDLQQAGKTLPMKTRRKKKRAPNIASSPSVRVRLAWFSPKIGEKAGVQVSDDEMQRSLFEQLRQFPDRKRKSSNTSATRPCRRLAARTALRGEGCRSPAHRGFGDRQKVSKEELTADDEADEKRPRRRPPRRRQPPRPKPARRRKPPRRRRRPRPRRRLRTKRRVIAFLKDRKRPPPGGLFLFLEEPLVNPLRLEITFRPKTAAHFSWKCLDQQKARPSRAFDVAGRRGP